MVRLKYDQLTLRKKDDRYEIYDLPIGDFTFSITRLNSGKATTGHSNKAKEVYYFLEGSGQIRIGEDLEAVKPGDIIVIPEDAFHRVFNDSYDKLTFICVFKEK